MDSKRFYILICTLLVSVGYIISRLVHLNETTDAPIDTLLPTIISFVSLVANIATIIGLGLAIYIYKSWDKQQQTVINENALLNIYSAFGDFLGYFLMYVAACRGQFNLYQKVAEKMDGVWTPEAKQILQQIELDKKNRKSEYWKALGDYAKQYDLFCIATGLDGVDSIQPLRINTLINDFVSLVEDKILTGELASSKSDVDEKQKVIEDINSKFLSSYDELRNEMTTLKKHGRKVFTTKI